MLPFYRIVNLGRLRDGALEKVEMPRAAVQTEKLLPLNLDLCLFYGETLICSNDAIGSEDYCLTSVFQGSERGCVKNTVTDERTCLYEKRENSVLVSLTTPALVHSMYKSDSHVVKPVKVNEFAVVPKSDYEVLIVCEKNTRGLQDTIRIGKRTRKAHS